MKFTKTLAVASVALGMALVSGAASALSIGLTGGSNVAGFGNDRVFTSGSLIVTADAWSNTGTGVNLGKIQTANLGTYSGGLGVCNQSAAESPNCGTPNHAVDNSGAFDSVLFSFNTAVDLDRVDFGYISGDADFSVLRYTGAGTVSSLANLTYEGMVAAGGGWSVVGNYNNGSSTNPIAGTNTSKYWLVAAFNTAFGAAATNLGTGNDYFKISAISVTVPQPTTTQVPEPATLALLGLGLAGVGFSRRRRH